MVLKLYGIGGSQPTRACMFFMKANNIPFESIQVMFGSSNEGTDGGIMGTKSASYMKVAQTGLVPALEDTDLQAGHAFSEASAILAYVADKYQLRDAYPTDLGTRAHINQWLSWYHLNIRQFTTVLFAPILFATSHVDKEAYENKKKRIRRQASIMDNQLSKTKFLTSSSPSIADYLCFEDMDPCRPEIFDLFDFSSLPNISRWLKDMQAIPVYKEVHDDMYDSLRSAVAEGRKRAGI